MIIEVLNAWCLLLAGALVLRSAGMRGWGIIPFAYLVGICLEIGFAFLQAMTPLPGSPWLTWALMLATAGAAWFARGRFGPAHSLPWLWVAAVGGAAAGAVALFRWLRVFTWHIDSLEYVQQAELLVQGRFASTADAYVLDKRLIAFPIIEAPAQLSGADILFSVVPLLAIATLGVLAWFLQVGVTQGLSRATATGVIALAVVGLATINRFVANAFYVNGHLLAAALLLLAAGSCWLLLEGPPVVARPMLVSLTLAAPALILVRPEGVFLTVLVVVPIVVSSSVPVRSRRLVAVATGTVGATWYGYVSVMAFLRDEDGPRALVVAGASLALVALGLVLPRVRPRSRVGVVLAKAPLALDWGLWLGVALATVAAPRLMADSVSALVLNAGAINGVWGLSFDILAALVVVALVLRRGGGLAPLRAVVTGFLPAAFILAYLRGSAYRVAAVDSLNRMLFEVVPVAVLLVAAVAAGRQTDHARPRRELAPRATARSVPR
jgi:hypothetical protein